MLKATHYCMYVNDMYSLLTVTGEVHRWLLKYVHDQPVHCINIYIIINIP